VSDTCIKDSHVYNTRTIRIDIKYPIQQIIFEFLIILTRLQHNFKNDKYNNFIKTKTYCISFYYNFRNKK